MTAERQQNDAAPMDKAWGAACGLSFDAIVIHKQEKTRFQAQESHDSCTLPVVHGAVEKKSQELEQRCMVERKMFDSTRHAMSNVRSRMRTRINYKMVF